MLLLPDRTGCCRGYNGLRDPYGSRYSRRYTGSWYLYWCCPGCDGGLNVYGRAQGRPAGVTKNTLHIADFRPAGRTDTVLFFRNLGR